MAPSPVFAIVRLTLLASVHGFNVNTAAHLSTCRYPSICQDNCVEGFVEPRCPDSTSDCPCIIKDCWTLNGSCIHACSETSIAACLECLDSAPETLCDVECSRVCLDPGCEHSQGECHGCAPGVYGQSCSRSCSSVCNGACYKDTGYCKLCQHRRHGVNCEHTCTDNCHACSSQNGTCLRCAKGYTGEHCSRPCADGLYGFQCHSKCSRNCAGTCDRVSGSCVGGCKPGYFRPDCGQMCPLGKFGQDCASECAVTCFENMVCHHINGSCTHGCSSGFHGQQCGLPCPLGAYGENCNKNCSENCFFRLCNRFSGHCHRCDVGRNGLFCEYVTHARRTRTNIDDGTMTTDQTILIFLGLFAMGGAMWFLLGTFVYYKQKIIMKKMQQTGQLPKQWTTIVRRYPQYFYSPSFLSRSADVETSAAAHKIGTLQRRERTQTGGLDNSLGDEFTRQFRQELWRKVHMEGQRKSVLRQKLRKNIEMDALRKNAEQGKNEDVEGQGKNVDAEGQRNTFTVRRIEASSNSEKHISEDKTYSLAKIDSIVNTDRWCCAQGYSPDHFQDRTPNGEVYLLTKRSQNYEKLATMFEMEEDLTHEKAVKEPAKGVRDGTENIKAEATDSRRDLHVISRPATALESRRDAAGDTKCSSVYDMSLSATTGLETNSAQVPQGERRSADIIPGEGVPHQMLQHGVHLRCGADNKKRTPHKERQLVVDEARTSAANTTCSECGRQCVCSLACQYSAVTTADAQQDRLPALLERAKSSSHYEHLGQPCLQEHAPSRTSSSYSNMKLAAAPVTHSRNERVLLQPRAPEARIDSPADKSRGMSNQKPETPTAMASTGDETETEFSAARASSSGSSTAQTSRVKPGSSSTTGSEDQLSEATSTTIASTAITDASECSVVIKRASITESQHQWLQAALERQSQHYAAKTDLWPRVDEQNPAPGRSQYDTKPRGVFKRSIRNIVGVFGKLMGIDPGVPPQGVVGISSRATESAETRPTGDLQIHKLDSWRPVRHAAAEAAVPVTQITTRRQRRVPFRPATFALVKNSSSTDETLTERSSAMSSTGKTSSRTNKGDSTLTDASDIDNSSRTSSEEEPGTSTAANSEASSTAGDGTATPSGDVSEGSTEQQTTTEAESPPALTKSDSPNSSRHHRSHRHRHHH